MSNSLGQIRQRSPAHWSARWLLAAHTHTRWFKKGKISDFFKWPIFSGLSRVGYSLKCFSVGFLSLLSEDPATWPVSCVTACKKKNTNTVSALFCHHGVFMQFYVVFFFCNNFFFISFWINRLFMASRNTFHSMLLFFVLVFIVYSSRSHEVVHNKACHCKWCSKWLSC